MNLTVEIEGLERLRRRLDGLARAFEGEAKRAALDSAETVRAEAMRALQEPRSGARPRRGGHRASAPGEAPASDSGRLAGSLAAELDADGISAWAGVRGPAARGGAARYAAFLEFGTARMAARPWLLPAFERTRATIIERIRQGVGAALKSAGTS